MLLKMAYENFTSLVMLSVHLQMNIEMMNDE